METVDVEFEFFNMKPDVDFHGLKALLRQLFDVDAQLFDISELANLILAQPTIGSTVKVDGEETDPYAFLTVLNMREHGDKHVMKDLKEYILEKASDKPPLSNLKTVMASPTEIGLVLTERLINVPTELAPPMYSMVLDEIEAAVEDKEPYRFTHYLILSKTYKEIESALDREDRPRTKKSKGSRGGETFFFHAEDEVLQKHAIGHGLFEYTKDGGDTMADSKRAFQELGIKPQGMFMLIEASKFEDAVKAVAKFVGGPV
jgi:protein BCP1